MIAAATGMPAASGTLGTPMTPVTVYSTSWCPWCDRAKSLLNARGIEFDDVNIETQPNFRRALLDLTGGYTVPQIVIGNAADRRLPAAARARRERRAREAARSRVGGSRHPQKRWQRGQYVVPRWAMTVRRMIVPQRSHGSPPRP